MKKGGEISYNSNERLIALKNLDYVDGEVEGRKARFYFPRNLSFFKEPDTQRMGRHITSTFSESVLRGNVDFETALESLRSSGIEEEVINEEYILERMSEAINNGRIPNDSKIAERLSEIRFLKEMTEARGLVA